MIQVNDPAATSLNGPLALVMLLAMALALPISFGLIRLYRRAVSKSMRRRAEPVNASEVQSSPPADQSGVQKLPQLIVVDAASRLPAQPEEETLHRTVLRAPWQAAAVYTLAGVGFAVTEAVLYLIANDLEIAPLRLSALSLIFFWPTVLTVNLVATTTPRAKLSTVVVYFLMFGTVGAVSLMNSPEASLAELPLAWAIFNLPATVLLLTFLNTRVRAVGPLVLIFMIIAVLGTQLMLSLLMLSDHIISALAAFGSIGGWGARGSLFGLAVFGYFIVWPIGWLLLLIVKRLYQHKKISDQSITLDAIWLFFAFTNSLLLAANGTIWLPSGLLAFLVFKVVAWLGLRLLASPAPSKQSARLLVLRVFSRNRRSAKLFSALARHWRHIGSMHLIAGPDLATSTVEPHEFLDFVIGKLARRFIDGPEKLQLRTAEMDFTPDQDGRFRVNEFFCYDDTWKTVLGSLWEKSDAVLMDLRGFTADNEGCAYEINELINVAPLKHVVFVVETPADEKLLRETAVNSWRLMRPNSPNRIPAAGELKIFRFTGSRNSDLKHLLGALCNATISG